MALTTVFFPKDEPPGYRKAIVDEVDAAWFQEKGALTAEEIALKDMETVEAPAEEGETE